MSARKGDLSVKSLELLQAFIRITTGITNVKYFIGKFLLIYLKHLNKQFQESDSKLVLFLIL